jgi:hypothetical protein
MGDGANDHKRAAPASMSPSCAQDFAGVWFRFAPEKEWQQLTNYIARLLGDSFMWNLFSAASVLRAKGMFDLNPQMAELEFIYDVVIERRFALTASKEQGYQ